MSSLAESPLVLVVEDEPLLRSLAVEMVEDAGFAALGAGGAEEALALLRRHGTIAVVVTDVDMPGSMDGVALARSIHQQWPKVRLVITSGRGRPAAQSASDSFLPKPYRRESLIATLRKKAA